MEFIEMTSLDLSLMFALGTLIKSDNEEQKNRLYPILRNYAEISLLNDAFIELGDNHDNGLTDPTEEQINELVEKIWLDWPIFVEQLNEE